MLFYLIKPKMTLFLLPFLLIFSCHTNYASSHSYNAIFSFGDSYTDTGNLLFLLKNISSPIENYPYGETFFHHPTGRCSDGRLIIDFLAEEFSLPYLKAYLAHKGRFNRGANFAVGGASALDLSHFTKFNTTRLFPFNISLNFQLEWFDELKPSLCKTTKECKDYFGNSLFILGEIGINDYNILFFNGVTPAQVRPYVSKVVKTISTAIERLISQGAKTIVVSGNIPIGCLPTILTLFKSHKKDSYDPKNGCLKEYNMLSQYHNSLLREAINKMRIKYSHTKIIYADFYEPVFAFIKHPKHFGWNTPLRTCCGKGGQYNWNFNETCGMPHVNSCENPSRYINWDGIHLTEAAYRKIAHSWLKGPYANPPIVTDRKG
ncbi:hypothetical protein LUZ60_009726 [Juncus effusus]|nr:hypothetical protein LUZ60_009726 [Juncus effusus]